MGREKKVDESTWILPPPVASGNAEDLDNVIFVSTFGRSDQFTMSTLARKVDRKVTGWNPDQYHHLRFSLIL